MANSKSRQFTAAAVPKTSAGAAPDAGSGRSQELDGSSATSPAPVAAGLGPEWCWEISSSIQQQVEVEHAEYSSGKRQR